MIKLRTILLQSNIYRVTIVGVIIYALIVTLLPKYESVYKGSEEDFLCSIDNYKIEEDKIIVDKAKCRTILLDLLKKKEYKKADLYKTIIKELGADKTTNKQDDNEIKEYIGNEFKGNYPIYKILPVSNVNIDNGLQINEVFNENKMILSVIKK